jgi:hypothetical protein
MTLACAPRAELGREKCFMVRWANHNHRAALRPRKALCASASSGACRAGVEVAVSDSKVGTDEQQQQRPQTSAVLSLHLTTSTIEILLHLMQINSHVLYGSIWL